MKGSQHLFGLLFCFDWDNQVDGEKYFLYAYSLSNYESLGEAYDILVRLVRF